MDAEALPGAGRSCARVMLNVRFTPVVYAFAISLSEWSQFGHSNVRFSRPGSSGSIRASNILVPHLGQAGDE